MARRQAVGLLLTRSHQGFARWPPQSAGAGGGHSHPLAPCAPPGSALNGDAGPPFPASASSVAVAVEAADNTGWAAGEWVPSRRAAAGPHPSRAQARGCAHVAAYRERPAPEPSVGKPDARFFSWSADRACCRWHRSARARLPGPSGLSSESVQRPWPAASLHGCRRNPRTRMIGLALARSPPSSLLHPFALASCKRPTLVGRECLSETTPQEGQVRDTRETGRGRTRDGLGTARVRIHHCIRPRMQTGSFGLASACPMPAPPTRRQDHAHRTHAGGVEDRAKST